MTDTIEARWEQQNEAGRQSFTDGDFARAEQAFLAAIREATQLGADNVRLASSLSNLGQLKYKQKDLAQAEALFHRALAIRERVLGPEHFGLVQNINNLAALHYARNELDQAEPLFQRALAISEQHLGEAHPDVAVTLNNLARLYFRRTDYAAAEPLLARLLAIKEQALGASHPEIAAILTSLAKVRIAAEDYDGGERYASRALEIREKLHLPNDLAVATALEMLADICGKRGQLDQEMQLRVRVLDVRTSAMGADHPTVIALRTALETRRAAAAAATVAAAAAAAAAAAPPPPSAPPVAAALPAAEPPAAPIVMTPPRIVMPPAPQQSPPRTTRTSSLPWIEVPEPPAFDRTRPPGPPVHARANGEITGPRNGNGNGHSNGNGNGNGNGIGISAPHTLESPLAFHPSSDATHLSPLAPPIAHSAPPPAPMAPPVAQPMPAESPFTSSFERMVAETPASRHAIDEDAPPPDVHSMSDSRREISLDWPIEPKRPWVRIVMGIAALALIAGGGWFFLSRYQPSAAKPSATSATTAAPKTAPALVAVARHDSVTPRHDSVAAVVPPAAEHSAKGTPSELASSTKPAATPPADASAHGDAKHVAKNAAGATPTSDKAAAAPSSDGEDIAAPALPSIKVDAITNMIDDNARERADSVGRVITQKPPTFKPKAYKPPES